MADTVKNATLLRQKRKNLWRYRSGLQNSFVVPPNYPLEIFIEATNSCNLRCRMCARSQPEGMKEYSSTGEITNDILEKVYFGFEYALVLNAFGFGEPLLYSQFLPLLERAKATKLFIGFFTNGTLLTPDISRNLIELKVDQIYISLSAVSAEAYSHIHIGGSLNKVLGNICELNLIKKISGAKLPRVYINFIVMEDNLEELPQLIDTVVRYGITGIDIKPLIIYNAKMKKYFRKYQPQRDDPILQKSKTLAKRYGLSVNVNSYCRTLEEKTKINIRPLCTQPFRSIYVRWNGSVRTDCFGGPTVGDLKHQSFQEVWYSDILRKMRMGIYQGQYPPECDHCLANYLGDEFENYDEILDRLYPSADLKEENSIGEHQERYIPGVGSAETAYEHIARYKFALKYIDKKAVLDIGCGTGYGSRIIATSASKVVGIDISEEGISTARHNFSAENIHYLIGNIIYLPFPEKSFEYAVCFEAIEHITETEEFLKEVYRVLSDHGVLIVSTPDTKIYSHDCHYLNPYHKKEMSEEEFCALLRRYFPKFEIYHQGTVVGNLIWKEKDITSQGNIGAMPGIEDVVVGNCHQSALPEFYTDPNPIIGPYLIAVCWKKEGLPKREIKDSYLYLDKAKRAINEKSSWITKLERQRKEINTQLKKQGAYLEKVHKTLNWRDRQLARANARWQQQGKYIEKVHMTLKLRDEELKRRNEDLKKLNSLFIVRVYRRVRALLKIPLDISFF